jgi:hypothetical protein
MHFPQYDVIVLDPNAMSKERLNNVDIVFYSRNIPTYDWSFLLSLRKGIGQCRFVFLDTELNKNLFLLNSTLLLKKIEYHTLKRYFRKIERYYIPIVLGENMNWSTSLNHMSENDISLVSYLNGSINVIDIGSLLHEIISHKSICPRSCKVNELAEDYSVDLELIEESIVSKLMFYIKYNPVMSFVVLLKNQLMRHNVTRTISLNKNSVKFTGFYKLVISE